LGEVLGPLPAPVRTPGETVERLDDLSDPQFELFIIMLPKSTWIASLRSSGIGASSNRAGMTLYPSSIRFEMAVLISWVAHCPSWWSLLRMMTHAREAANASPIFPGSESPACISLYFPLTHTAAVGVDGLSEMLEEWTVGVG